VAALEELFWEATDLRAQRDPARQSQQDMRRQSLVAWSSGRLDTGACRSWGFHSTRQATRCHTAPGEYCLRVEEVRASRIVRRFLCAAPMARIPLELLIAVAQRY